MLDFDDSLQSALGLSDALTQTFLRAGLRRVRDVLLTLPLRYEDRSHLTPVAALRDGQTALVHGYVQRCQIQEGRRRLLRVEIKDDNGDVFRLVYFRFYPSQIKPFRENRRGLFYGKVAYSSYGYDMAHPEITWLDEGDVVQLPDSLQAVYPSVKGLSQMRWRQAVHQLLAQLPSAPQDPLSAAGYWDFARALHALHQPSLAEVLPCPDDNQHPAKKRLIIEELAAHQLSLHNARTQLRRLPAPALPADSPLVRRFLQSLPFQLTEAQARVYQEIAADMARPVPMLRLVQGDVGSGKTVIALLACLQAVAAGKQAVFMAPTELLAEQHAQNMQRLLADLPLRSVLLVSKLRAKEKRQILAEIAAGEAHLIIGTHAVFQEQVQYQDLALVAVDEQHRFGVHQRLQLQEKAAAGQAVHQLVLTATPIPRTLAMSAYGELDTSIIDVLPAGRQPIRTSVMSNARRDELIARVGAACRQGAQAYWVCPLIEESEVLECENAEAISAHIQALLPDVRVALVHGRIESKERSETMRRFVAAEIELLVATTVIEVGVDVPNASLMVIENAERFGLSQLHQLRGRVGRGSVQSDCILMYQAPLGETAKRRLNMMRDSTDGFRIAEEDLRIRGAGELLGTRQTGALGLKIADIERDQALLAEAEQIADALEGSDYAAVLLARWIGKNTEYLKV